MNHRLAHSSDPIRTRAEKLFPQQKAQDAAPLPKLSDLIAMKAKWKLARRFPQRLRVSVRNFHQSMTAQQLVDLVEYLGSLRGMGF